MNDILYPVISLGGIAIVASIILFVVAKQFKVEEDPRIDKVNETLPGANCGGCGYPGCRGFAEALVKAADEKGDISEMMCPPGGNNTMKEVGTVLNLEVADAETSIAVVRCGGDRIKAPEKIKYDGAKKCSIVNNLFSGEKSCPYGCLGFGDCVVVCDFDAIYMDEELKLPVVNDDKCVGCGACAKVCPRNVIEIRLKGRKEKRVWINCVNKEKGAVAKKNCQVACIACKKCEKVCPVKVNAITVENNLAYIDFKKCIACGKCINECPTGAILATFTPPKKKEKKEEIKAD